ncbi:Riboflavin kinase, bacterial [Syntrophomonas zehnderi OL-4]|uniref:Riboflavin biosynthesis protein n=1 Tax=Syntrophomonas zehnderi OL-4 TaxID=690567 RepID=A0A0E4C8U1_9FIRM|nr:bifunctional riboflavin kinase/FAD synthetase [Syntrophomonas zehnderi]CFX67825.1 Riboflavin kinase, bacterial [Syntrophomonas zehnderi OL-4]
MQIVLGMENYRPAEKDLFLALGNFDGVHRGHQSLIDQLLKRKHEAQGMAGAFVFEPHPTQILTPERMPPLLSSPQRKAQLLEKFGLDLLIYSPFSRDIAAWTPEQFVADFLIDKLHVKGVFVGFNYSFGHRGIGTPQLLQLLGQTHGFEVHIIPPVKVEDEVVSSTLIRQALEKGDLTKARRMLGYRPVMDGIVVEGDQRGRQLGFPTANVGIDRIYSIPARGVYAAKAWLNNQEYSAVVNIGSKPTFYNEYPVSIEAHLIDFTGDIYGQEVSLSLIEKLRDEERFASVEELIAQIGRDRDRAAAIAKDYHWDL